MRLTPSQFSDQIWLRPSKSNGKSNIHFDEVFARNPKMRDTAKTFLWAKLNGLNGAKVIGWTSARDKKSRLKVIADALERDGLDGFEHITPKWVLQFWETTGKTEGNKSVIGDLLRMFECKKLPHLPLVNPLRLLRLNDFDVAVKVKKTVPLTDEWFFRIVRRAMEYQAQIPALKRLGVTKNWDGRLAKRLKIDGVAEYNRRVQGCRMAAAICIWSATGMRKNELLSLEAGALKLQQTNGPLWVLWGTVYKFHGVGSEAKWICGELGKIGYDMLRGFGNAGPLIPRGGRGTFHSVNACNLLRLWLASQGWADAPMDLHPHTFRHTVARLLFREKINILGIKEQFKHKTTTMPDYYVGNDGQLYADILHARPEADLSAYQDAQLAALDDLEQADEAEETT